MPFLQQQEIYLIPIHINSNGRSQNFFWGEGEGGIGWELYCPIDFLFSIWTLNLPTIEFQLLTLEVSM